MKTRSASIILALTLISTLAGQLSALEAQGTAFTYQGRLNSGGSPANGQYDLAFTLYNSSNTVVLAGPATNSAVTVSNGLFTTTIDFGAPAFNSSGSWLGIAVRTNGNGAFSALTPHEQVTPAPYAITAQNLASVVLNNHINGAGEAIGGGTNNIATNFNSTIGGGANNVASGNASTVSGGSENQATGDHATVSGGQDNIASGDDSIAMGYRTKSSGFISTAMGLDNTASGEGSTTMGYANTAAGLNSVVMGEFSTASGEASTSMGYDNRAYGYASTSMGSSNTVSGEASFVTGYSNNVVGTNSVAIGEQNMANGEASAAIGILNRANGDDSIAMGYRNKSSGFISTAMGLDNTASGESSTTMGYANTAAGLDSVVMGEFSTASGEASTSMGYDNRAYGYASTSMGSSNTVSGEASVAMGYYNNVVGSNSVVIGEQNMASGEASAAIGIFNLASGRSAVASGANAQATNDNTFVWADGSSSAPFASTGPNQFLIRATGGVGIGTGSPQGGLHVYSDNNPTVVRIQSTGTPGFGRVEFVSNPQTDPNQWRPAYIQSLDESGFTGGLGFYVNGTGAGNKFGNNEVMRIVNGNVGIGNTAPGNLLVVGGSGSPAYCNGTTWVNGSDRNSKEAFSAINPRKILEQVSTLPITEWKYKTEAGGTEHLGPMAQDFHAAFGLNGADDKHIATVDEEGVALAAIQGLNLKLEEKEARNQEQAIEIAGLKQDVAELRQLVQTLVEKKSGR